MRSFRRRSSQVDDLSNETYEVELELTKHTSAPLTASLCLFVRRRVCMCVCDSGVCVRRLITTHTHTHSHHNTQLTTFNTQRSTHNIQHTTHPTHK